jgi:hypothetical protein
MSQKKELLTQLISAYDSELTAKESTSDDTEIERRSDIRIFIQQLRVMLAGEATDVELHVPVQDEAIARGHKRARPATKGWINLYNLELQGIVFLYAWDASSLF